MKAETMTFAEACRENTGTHLLDSGDAYGRHHEQPPIPGNAPMIRGWPKGEPATIETAVFLAEYYDILRDVQKDWEQWDEEQDNLSWFESGQAFMEARGYFQQARDNICNSENDMSQVWVFEVYTRRKNDDREHVYNHDDTVVVLYIHTGCDVRRGYGRPIFCRAKAGIDYAFPADACAQYHVNKAWNGDGEEIDLHALRYGIDEKWQCGCSSYPYGQLEQDVKTWHEETRTRDTVEVTLETGERVLVQADAPFIV